MQITVVAAYNWTLRQWHPRLDERQFNLLNVNYIKTVALILGSRIHQKKHNITTVKIWDS